MKNKKNYLMMLVLSLIVVTLVGCGKKEEEATDTETATTEVAEDTVADTEEKFVEPTVIVEEPTEEDTRVKSFDEFSEENLQNAIDVGAEHIKAIRQAEYRKEMRIAKGLLLGRTDDIKSNPLVLFYECIAENGDVEYVSVTMSTSAAMSGEIHDYEIQPAIWDYNSLEEGVAGKTVEASASIIILDEKDF